MQEIEELLNMSQRKHGDLIRAKNDADQRVGHLRQFVQVSNVARTMQHEQNNHIILFPPNHPENAHAF